MTKIQLHFDLTGPLDETLMERISRATSLYGLYLVQVTPNLDGLNVEYDASRLNPLEVEAALWKSGIPVKGKN